MSILTAGLVSVSFRPLSPEAVVQLCLQAGLKSIEWGGDIHVPAGKWIRAQQVGQFTREAGMTVAAYGSYYRLGNDPQQKVAFETVLESAVALGAPTIRVWAAGKSSAEISERERQDIVADAVRTSALAQREGITLSLEYHAGTLTDTTTSVATLMRELADTAVEFLWQPPVGEDVATCVLRLEAVLPRLRNVHVFHWWPTHLERHPLREGERAWKRYIEIVRTAGRPAHFLLEFVAGDSPDQLLADAANLRQWLVNF